MEESNGFKMFSDCIPVLGYKRGIIYDLGRNKYKFVPISMIEFIKKSEGISKEEIFNMFSSEEHVILNEYFTFLEENEFIFWAPESLLNNFPEISTEWNFAATISNAILDINKNSDYDINAVLDQLEILGCRHIQIRSYCIKKISFYEDILNHLLKSRYLSIEIITQFDNENTTEIVNLLKIHQRLKIIIFHSARLTKVIKDDQGRIGNIAFTKEKINSPNNFYDNNHKDYFNVSVPLYIEAKSFHSYFNRKITIDKDGYIKNCSSQKFNFGNVKTDKIAGIVNNSNFQKLWFVTKDKTAICKICEFRYMCMDCRIPKEDSFGQWMHDVDCNYNPYIAKWKGEMGYLCATDYVYDNFS